MSAFDSNFRRTLFFLLFEVDLEKVLSNACNPKPHIDLPGGKILNLIHLTQAFVKIITGITAKVCQRC